MTEEIGVAVIGAGPYGLSIGAHLLGRGIDCRVFGQPMSTWQNRMPKGMHLKSDGFASTLSDPKDEFTLERYCADHDIDYADLGTPVALETFVNYGLAFQQRYVPDLDQRSVASVRLAPRGFLLELEDGTEFTARRVVIAVGITNFGYVPDMLSDLPPELCSHSSSYGDLDHFAGRKVAVLGAGSSALDIAALLHKAGATTQLIARVDEVKFHNKGALSRPLGERIRWPISGIGPGWKSRFFTDAAPVFHRLPAEKRIALVASKYGPVGCWFTRDEVIGKVELFEGCNVMSAKASDRDVHLEIRRSNGDITELDCDHLIAATGYSIDLKRVKVIAPELSARITTAGNTPVLSSHFESSVPGLFFVGALAANSFGPMLRFAFGDRFVARRLSRHLATQIAK